MYVRTPSAHTDTADCLPIEALQDSPEPAHLEKYGEECPLYSRCFFSYACTSMGESTENELRKVSLDRGETIYLNQIETDGIYVIQSGILTSFFYLSSGEPVVMGNLGKGQTVGELEILRTRKGPYNVKALTPVHLCRLSMGYILQFVKHSPSLMVSLVAAGESAASSLSRQLWVMNAQRVYDRLARLLMVLSDLGSRKGFGVVNPIEISDENMTPIQVSHQDLGFLINTDRISITRSLHKMAEEKLVILDYKRILITDSLISRFSEQGFMTY